MRPPSRDALEEFAREGDARHPSRAGRLFVPVMTGVVLVAAVATLRPPEPTRAVEVPVPTPPGARAFLAGARPADLVETVAATNAMPVVVAPIAAPDIGPIARRETNLRVAVPPAPVSTDAATTRAAEAQVASAALESAAAAVADFATDAAPRRIAPAAGLEITTLGGRSQAGRLSLLLDVSEDGAVTGVSNPEAAGLDPAVVDSVLETVSRWRYEPARRDGVPVPARVRVTVDLKAP